MHIVHVIGLHLSRSRVRTKLSPSRSRYTRHGTCSTPASLRGALGLKFMITRSCNTDLYIRCYRRITCVPRCNQGGQQSEHQKIAQRGENRCMRNEVLMTMPIHLGGLAVCTCNAGRAASIGIIIMLPTDTKPASQMIVAGANWHMCNNLSCLREWRSTFRVRCVCVGVLQAQGTQLGIENLAANSECMCVYACDCIVCVMARCERARASVVVMMGLHLSRS